MSLTDMSTAICFEVSGNELSLHKFDEGYKRCLPQVISISGGHYAENLNETFDRGQVLRIEKRITQTRVRAVVIQGPSILSRKTLSIPLDFNAEFARMKKGKPGKKSYVLQRLIQKYRLPVEVRYCSASDTISVSGSMRNADHLILKLLNTYEEVFFLGNCLSKNKLLSSIVLLPLRLSSLRVSIVTGNLGYMNWNDIKRTLDGIARSCINFDAYTGNPEITVHGEEKLIGGMDISSDEYTSLRLCMENERKAENVQAYGQLLIGRQGERNSEHLYDIIPADSTKGRNITHTQTDAMGITDNTLLEVPPVPKRPGVKLSEVYNERISVEMHQAQVPFDPTPKLSEVYNEKQIKSIPNLTPSTFDVTSMKIDDVGKVLGRLGLGNHVESFSKNRIDGTVLANLSSEILECELKMSKIGSIKLMKYIKTGHIPS